MNSVLMTELVQWTYCAWITDKPEVIRARSQLLGSQLWRILFPIHERSNRVLFPDVTGSWRSVAKFVLQSRAFYYTGEPDVGVLRNKHPYESLVSKFLRHKWNSVVTINLWARPTCAGSNLR